MLYTSQSQSRSEIARAQGGSDLGAPTVRGGAPTVGKPRLLGGGSSDCRGALTVRGEAPTIGRLRLLGGGALTIGGLRL